MCMLPGLGTPSEQLSAQKVSNCLHTWGKLLLELLAEGTKFFYVAAERPLLTEGATTTSRKICSTILGILLH